MQIVCCPSFGRFSLILATYNFSGARLHCSQLQAYRCDASWNHIGVQVRIQHAIVTLFCRHEGSRVKCPFQPIFPDEMKPFYWSKFRSAGVKSTSGTNGKYATDINFMGEISGCGHLLVLEVV